MEYLTPEDRFDGSFCPDWLIEREEVSPGGKMVYARLLKYAKKEKGKPIHAWPGVDVIGMAVGLSGRQVKRYVAELRELFDEGHAADEIIDPLVDIEVGVAIRGGIGLGVHGGGVYVATAPGGKAGDAGPVAVPWRREREGDAVSGTADPGADG